MTETTPKLQLPLIAAAQAQKHVTHNEALLRLDALSGFIRVISRGLTSPPGFAADGDIYLLPAAGSGGWAGFVENDLAWAMDGSWTRIAPTVGMIGLLADEYDRQIRWTGSRWESMTRLMFTPGGDGTVSIYRTDTTSAQNPRTAVIDSISGDTITLTSAIANSFFSFTMGGVSMARIWNTTLSPDSHSAWVKTYVGASSLQISDVADIAGWASGNTIQLGDPTSITPNRCITLDISPMLINLFGQPFRQSGLIVKANMIEAGSTAGDSLGLSADGSGGSFVNAAVRSAGDGTTLVSCTELSPVSNSNLVRVRESISATAGIRLVSSVAVAV